MMNGNHSSGLSRRDLLKRGAIVGAAAAWTVPLVQVVSMSPAHADSPSGGPVPPPPIKPTKPVTPPTTPTAPPTTPAAPPTTPTGTPTDPTTPSTTSSGGGGGSSSGGGGSSTTSGTASSLAYTGTEFPVAPTVGVGLAAVALGAGAIAGAQLKKRSGEASEDS